MLRLPQDKTKHAVVVGLGVGLALGFVIDAAIRWRFQREASNLLQRVEPQLQASIRRTLDREVPPRVKRAIDEKLQEFGLGPATLRRAASLFR